jgi:Protein of unknown function (DUF2586)
MANDVVFIKGAGGLGRPLAGEDYISALLFYTSVTLPTGFTSLDRIKQVFSLSDAEALGITDTQLGATASTATFQITNKGAAGDAIALTVSAINGTLTLASYAQVAADVVTIITSAARLASEINLGTLTHGWTALSNGVDTVTLTAPKTQGIYLNTGTPYSIAITGTFAGTLVQNVVVGVASTIDIMHYHVQEYFRVQPKGNLYIGIYAISATFAEVTTMQDFTQGAIRQIGVYTQAAYASGTVTLLQTQATANEVNHKPLEILYNPDFSGTIDLTTLVTLHTLTAQNVSVLFGQDGAAIGYTRWKATGKSIGCLGTTLGAVALAKVSDSIAWVAKFNVASTEYDVLNFSNGQVYTVISDGSLNNLDSKGYIFLKKHIGLSGSYFNNPYTAIAVTSDYSRINNNRTINKAIRGLRTFLLPQLSSPVTVNADGTLTEDVISFFETLCKRALDVMQRDAELSAFDIIINPAQNVLSTSKLIINVKIVPIGTADTIEVNVGFVLSI